MSLLGPRRLMVPRGVLCPSDDMGLGTHWTNSSTFCLAGVYLVRGALGYHSEKGGWIVYDTGLHLLHIIDALVSGAAHTGIHTYILFGVKANHGSARENDTTGTGGMPDVGVRGGIHGL